MSQNAVTENDGTGATPTRCGEELPVSAETDREMVKLVRSLEPGDKILWGDRQVSCTVARYVEQDDPVGQAMTAWVIPRVNNLTEDSDLVPGDTFLDPTGKGLTGKEFALVQGPRGGFYALAVISSRGRRRPAMFRAVRSRHKTGNRSQGSFSYQKYLDSPLKIVEMGDRPDTLDPDGDLPKFVEIASNRLMFYDSDTRNHESVCTVAEGFEMGLEVAREKTIGTDDSNDAETESNPVPEPGSIHELPETAEPLGTIRVQGIEESDGTRKALLETPAPWGVDGTGPNEIIKSTPYPQTEYEWDGSRELWLVAASEVETVALVFRDEGYAVVDDREPTDTNNEQVGADAA